MDGLRRWRWRRLRIAVHLADEALLLPLAVRPGDTVSDVRARLVRRGVGSWGRTFYYNAHALRDHQTLRDARLPDGAVLLLARGPGPGPQEDQPAPAPDGDGSSDSDPGPRGGAESLPAAPCDSGPGGPQPPRDLGGDPGRRQVSPAPTRGDAEGRTDGGTPGPRHPRSSLPSPPVSWVHRDPRARSLGLPFMRLPTPASAMGSQPEAPVTARSGFQRLGAQIGRPRPRPEGPRPLQEPQ